MSDNLARLVLEEGAVLVNIGGEADATVGERVSRNEGVLEQLDEEDG